MIAMTLLRDILGAVILLHCFVLHSSCFLTRAQPCPLPPHIPPKPSQQFVKAAPLALP